MNILQINSWDNVGGAGRVAFRLHRASASMGMGTRMIVRVRTTRDANVYLSSGDGLLRLMETQLAELESRLGFEGLFYPSTFLLPFRRHFKWADVVHLHNVHGGYFNLLALPVLTAQKPLVWTLHDMWAITGHCSHAFDCSRWMRGCGACAYLDTPPAVRRDATELMWRIKRTVLKHSRLTLVAPSRWLKDRVEASPIGACCRCYLIPNAVDVHKFAPWPSAWLRRLHDIPVDSLVIALTAPPLGATSKGPRNLPEFIDRLCQQEVRPVLLVFGETGVLDQYRSQLGVIELGWVSDERLMAQYMSAADLYVMTSSAENAPLSVIEAMACGTPVVAFDVGGISEIVRPPLGGLLAPLQDIEGLAQAVVNVLRNDNLRSRMGAQARRIVEQEYSLDRQAQRYLALYEQVIEERAALNIRQRKCWHAPAERSRQ